jgi:diadenosine tetraphosphate (Ap4A) HIT family hydrolase
VKLWYSIGVILSGKSMPEDFSQDLIKDYTYWKVNVHQNQSYLGRCVVWCKRDDALDMTDATFEEHQELLQILKELRRAALELFNPDWLNYAFLGNEMRHLHGHFIPRYATKRTFAGVEFEDKLYGHNYQTDRSFVTSFELRQEIKQQYIRVLNSKK